MMPGLADGLSRLGAATVGCAFVLRLLVSGGAAGAGSGFFIHALTWTGVLIALLGAYLRGGGRVRLWGAAAAMALWSLLGLASVSWASHPWAAMGTSAEFVTHALILLFLLHLDGPERRRWWISYLLPAAGVIALYAVLQTHVLLPAVRAALRAGTEHAPVSGEAMEEWSHRLQSPEAFGTFLYPNHLAGFLALVLPALVAGMAAAWRSGAARLAWSALAGLAAWALALTGSKGGWIAAVGGLIFFAILCRVRPPARVRWVTAAMALILAAVTAVVAAPGLLRKAGAASRSVAVRAVYAEAAGRVWRGAPLRGVGLDNFQEFYPQEKPDDPEETTRVHNDPLEVLCELGLIGFALWAAFWLLTLRAAAGADPPVDAGPPAGFSPRSMIGILLVFAIAFLFGTFREVAGCGWVWPVMVLAWIFFSAALRTAPDPATLHAALLAGLVAFLIHGLGDFDLYEAGVAQAAFVTAALALGAARPEAEWPVGRGGIVAAAVALGLFLVPLLWLTPRWMDAETSEARAQKLLTEGRPDRALEALDEAAASNPLRADLRLHAALLATRAAADMGELEAVLARVEGALAVRPRGLEGWDIRRDLHERLAEAYREGDGGSRDKAQAHGHDVMALEAARRMRDLYPSSARFRYHHARLLGRLGYVEDAKAEYREALRLSGMARLARMKLTPEMEREAGEGAKSKPPTQKSQ